MFTRTLGIATLALAAAAAPARADIMHWFWEVEVNGLAVDATRPVVVAAGDSVDIALRSTWDPHRWGLAESVFSIHAGDHFFDVAAAIDIDESRGYGRHPAFTSADDFGGGLVDTDNSGSADVIDLIWLSQLPPMFGHDDQSNPLRAYSLRWDIRVDLAEQAVLERVPTFVDALLIDRVYSSPQGGYADYDATSSLVVFVPSPMSVAPLLFGLQVLHRGTRGVPGAA